LPLSLIFLPPTLTPDFWILILSHCPSHPTAPMSERRLTGPGRWRTNLAGIRIDIQGMGGEACMAAQINRFSARLQRNMIKSFSEHIGGYMRSWEANTDHTP